MGFGSKDTIITDHTHKTVSDSFTTYVYASPNVTNIYSFAFSNSTVFCLRLKIEMPWRPIYKIRKIGCRRVMMKVRICICTTLKGKKVFETSQISSETRVTSTRAVQVKVKNAQSKSFGKFNRVDVTGVRGQVKSWNDLHF